MIEHDQVTSIISRYINYTRIWVETSAQYQARKYGEMWIWIEVQPRFKFTQMERNKRPNVSPPFVASKSHSQQAISLSLRMSRESHLSPRENVAWPRPRSLREIYEQQELNDMRSSSRRYLTTMDDNNETRASPVLNFSSSLLRLKSVVCKRNCSSTCPRIEVSLQPATLTTSLSSRL